MSTAHGPLEDGKSQFKPKLCKEAEEEEAPLCPYHHQYPLVIILSFYEGNRVSNQYIYSCEGTKGSWGEYRILEKWSQDFPVGVLGASSPRKSLKLRSIETGFLAF